MNILVIGSGGREHALVWKIAQSPRVKKIYCAPGNGGISHLAECVFISPEDSASLIEFAQKKKIDLTVVGPEAPLAKGLVDDFERAKLKVFGPTKKAAILEASKCFTKDFCAKYKIPTADYSFFNNTKDAKEFLEKQKNTPVVIKADGLAAGKGVIIAQNKVEAYRAIDDMIINEKFGEAGRRIVIEKFMEGEEASCMVITDGKNYITLASSQDHKRINDNDKGPNTGGMGAYSPAPVVTKDIHEKICKKVIEPLLAGMIQEDRPYRGILYAGLMIHKGEPKVVEFNCRFGDPEAQPILFRMKSDFVDLIEAALDGKLAETKVDYLDDTAVCVVLSSKGYPGSFDKGKPISGLDQFKKSKNVTVFHAGTKIDKGQVLTNGGRVLGVTALGGDLIKATDNVYKAVDKISWEGMHYRKDIGQKGLKHLS